MRNLRNFTSYEWIILRPFCFSDLIGFLGNFLHQISVDSWETHFGQKSLFSCCDIIEIV